MIPYHEKVKVGDMISVKDEMFTRGGQDGEVIGVWPEGVALDFYSSNCTPPEYISQEFWNYSELEMGQYDD